MSLKSRGSKNAFDGEESNQERAEREKKSLLDNSHVFTCIEETQVSLLGKIGKGYFLSFYSETQLGQRISNLVSTKIGPLSFVIYL